MPDAVDFGDVAVGLAGRKSLVLGNKGPGIITIIDAKPNAALADELRLDVVPAAVGAGMASEVPLVFTPRSPGVREGEIIITTDSTATPEVHVRVVGVGIDPRLRALPDQIDFGRVVVGTVRTATVSIENVGTEPVVVRAVTGDVDTSSEMTSVLRGIRQIDPGEMFTLSIAYQPIDAGFDQGRFILADDTPIPMRVSIGVRGEGVTSELSIDPAMINFTGVFVGETRRRFFDLKNLGAGPHAISRLELVGLPGSSELSIVTSTSIQTPFSLESGETRRVFVDYTPENAIEDNATVVIESDALLAPTSVFLTGNGQLPPFGSLAALPDHLSFGRVEIGTTSARRLRVKSVGNADVHLLGAIAVEPSDAPYTVVDAPPPNALFAPLDEHTLIVELTPTAMGPVEPAVLSIDSDDPLTPRISVPLDGEGTDLAARHIEVDPLALDLGHVPRGERAVRSIVLRSVGSAPVTVTAVTFLDDDLGRFTLPDPIAGERMIAPGDRLELAIAFEDPNGALATHAATVRIDTDDPQAARTDVPLSAETVDAISPNADLMLELSWNSGKDVDLHLLRDGGAVFDRPSDACFCSPNPDWGTVGSLIDDPFLEGDDLDAPGVERLSIAVADLGAYAIIVQHRDDGGLGTADVQLRVVSRGVVLGTVSRRIASGQEWDAGSVSFDDAGGVFSPSSVPLSSAVRDECF